ncbi:hypothetical protein PanWU01x14_023760 [Parasponia andersonii]|uniref:Uncharacterized protein n=1 Tax=Parasponia andersonii TaxID=3476 RepID=A0A2P5DXK8_PARAD|nr:hypothetical protein PanWU01x14_023760 [Parasponia andersonii]
MVYEATSSHYQTVSDLSDVSKQNKSVAGVLQDKRIPFIDPMVLEAEALRLVMTATLGMGRCRTIFEGDAAAVFVTPFLVQQQECLEVFPSRRIASFLVQTSTVAASVEIQWITSWLTFSFLWFFLTFVLVFSVCKSSMAAWALIDAL